MTTKPAKVSAASRWGLPQPESLCFEKKEDERLVQQPVIEKSDMEAFHYMIRDAGREDYGLSVVWWKPVKGNLGMICSMWGAVKWIDAHERRIKMVNDEESQWILMDRIVDVKSKQR